MKFERKKLAIAIFSGGAFSALATMPAMAQTPAGTIKVDVTGTNIRRVDAETPSEVQVITKEEMIQQGFTSISEVLRNLTQNSNGTLSTGFGRAFAAGGNGVSLRGLTGGSTLGVIGGHPMVGVPAG